MFNGHIHVHTEYSPLDGLAKIEELILRAKELGQKYIAITDHGSSSGLYEAYKLGKKHEFPVLLGEEFYYDNAGDKRKNGHLILIAKNENGLSNLFYLQAKAYENFYYKPRLSLDILKECDVSDLICTTACVANQVNQFILSDERHLAINHIKELQDIFKDDLYIELQSSTLEDVIKCNTVLEEFCYGYDLKPIITNDVHYTLKKDFDVHDVLLCIQQNQKVSSEKRFRFAANDYWLKDQKEMEKYVEYLKEETLQQCYTNLDEIYEKCKGIEITIEDHLPKYAQTKEEENAILEELTFKSYYSKIRDRDECNYEFFLDLHKELSVISKTGYSGYFLIVREYINWAKENGILVGDGRGSGAGSKVAYTLGITEINPQKHNLLFERFLTPGRQPDFDVDFSDIDAVYKHLQDIYGENNVARVGAFNRFTCKSALRKVMSVFGFGQQEINKIIKLLPDRLTFTLEEAIAENEELSKWLDKNENIKYIVSKLEGLLSHMSTHAGGVIICENLTKLLPVLRDSDDKDKLVVAYDKKIIEELGHYKFDILGLKSLTMMDNAIKSITDEIDWHKISLEDNSVYEMLQAGDVTGVFQLSEQRDKVIEQKPNCFEDLIAINALIRPGVGDWNEYIRRRTEEGDSECINYLKSTNGIIVYQEQYLLLAQTYASWDIAFSDNHIRKNKKITTDVELKEKFIRDAESNGYEKEKAEKVWEDIVHVVSSGYGFNRSHSCSYAKLSYQTAWIKKYYPKEFYAAYMTMNFDDSVEISKCINELKERGIKVLPPDINKSTNRFLPTEDGILWCITSIAGVGGSALAEINRLKPIKSFDDFMERRIKKFVKRTSIESLIMSGAFDFDTENRTELLKRMGSEIEPMKKFRYEKKSLGVYLSETPFDRVTLPSLNETSNGSLIDTLYEMKDIAIRHDKNCNAMAFATGLNNKESAKLVIFATTYKKYKDIIVEGGLYVIGGRKDGSSILVNRITKMEV